MPVAICDDPCYSPAGTARLRANGRVCRSRGETVRAAAPRDAALAVTSLNLQQRRMDESRRALAAAKMANLGAGRPPAAGTAEPAARNCALCGALHRAHYAEYWTMRSWLRILLTSTCQNEGYVS